MKKKVFLFVILALVLCLTCGMLLVACNKGGDKPNDNDDDTHTSSLVGTSVEETIKSVVNGLDAANKAEDGEFAFSIEISQIDKTGASQTVFGLGYEEIAGAYYIYAMAGGGSYVKINAASIGTIINDLFDFLAGSVNGFSMSGGYPSVAGITLSPAIINAVLPAMASNFLFSGAAESIDGAYVLDLDLAKIINNLPGIITAVGGFLKDDEGKPLIPEDSDMTLTQIIARIANVEEKTIEDNVVKYGTMIFGEEAKITGVDSLLAYLADMVASIEVKIGFMFDGRVADDATNPFVDVAGITDADRAKTAFNILNFNLGATVTGYEASTEEKEGEITVGSKLHTYDVSLETDINIFAALDMLTLVADAERSATAPAAPGEDATEEELAAYQTAYNEYRAKVDAYFDGHFAETMVGMLEKVGYINLTVDDENGKNLFTLYINGADGYAVITANVYAAAGNALDKDGDGFIEFGGTYDFEALVDYIIVMMESGWNGSTQPNTPAAETTAEGTETPSCPIFSHVDKTGGENGAADGKCDVCGATMPGIMDYASAIINVAKANFKVITGETGIRLDLGGILEGVLGLVNVDMAGALSGLDLFVQQLLSVNATGTGLDMFGILGGIEVLDIVVDIPTRVYGAVTTPAAGSFDEETFSADNGTTLVASIDASEATITYDGGDTGNGFVLGGTFAVTDIFGTTTTVNAEDMLLMWVDYDENAAASGQTVTAFVTVPTDVQNAMDGVSDHNNKLAYPLGGVYKLTFTVA